MKASYKPNEFHDIDQFMESAAAYLDIRSIQIQPGALFIKDHILEIDDLVIDHYSTSLKLLENLSIPPNHIFFSLGSSTISECKWRGIDVPVNSIAVIHPYTEHHSLMPANWDSFGIMLKKETAVQESLLSEYMWKQTEQPEKALFNYPALRIALLRAKLLSYFQTPKKLNTLIKNESTKLAFKNWVLDELHMIFLEIEDYQRPHNTLILNSSRRYRIYSKAIELIEENLANQLSVKQICDQIGTTPRTLQLCFKELSGVSPLQYIKARKLHAVQQELFCLKNSTKPIFHIAQKYGLSHAGRFSSEYKRLFLELPHEALKRRGDIN